VPVPGPAALGRGVVITSGQAVPEPWVGAPVASIDDAVLAAPGAAVASLHAGWLARRPVVVELAVDPARFREPQGWEVEPWTLDPAFDAALDRLHFLVWANTYDARAGEPKWWWAVKAARLGAEVPADDDADPDADVRLPDGTLAWIDGGPRGPLDHPSLTAAVVHAESVELGRLTVAPVATPPTAALAPDQLAAVAHGAGPARVIAPAGSGKTRVLTERLRHLRVDRHLEREAVLAVAYNVKARDEMVERSADFTPRVQTLNGLAFGLLADHRGTAPRVLDDREVRRILDRLAPKRRPRVNTDPLGPYLEALTTVRLGLRDPEEVEAERGDVPGLAGMVGQYRDELARAGAVDFDEQVYAAVEALLADGPFRRRAQAAHRHLLVDELQDLTPAHVLLVRLLATPALDVFGVGDDDQVIYQHAGADPRFLIDFDRFFPGAADHPLQVNYRCPERVVDAAVHLLSYNARRVPKEIHAGPAADPAADALRTRLDPPEAGAASVVEEVVAWLAEPGVAPDEVAVLARVNSLLLAPHVALAEAGVPLASALSPDVLSRTGIRAALAYLRLATSPDDLAPDDLAEVYRRPSRGLPNWITKWFRPGLDPDRLRAIADRIDDAKVGAKVERLADDLAVVVDAARRGTTRDVLRAVKDDIGLGEAMELLDRSKGGEGSSQLDDLEGLLQVADLHPDPAGFERWLRSVFRREHAPGGVTLSTVHRVKGREWDRVAVFGVTAGVLPHRLAADVEEERRVLHVAITRARHRVVVLGDATRPSPLLAELDGTAPHRPPGADPPLRRTAVAGAGGRSERAKVEPLTGSAATVEAALREWRTARAKADDVPAYVVAANAVVRTIAETRPATLTALSRVPGIGPAKLELYGEELLELLSRFDAEDT